MVIAYLLVVIVAVVVDSPKAHTERSMDMVAGTVHFHSVLPCRVDSWVADNTGEDNRRLEVVQCLEKLAAHLI